MNKKLNYILGWIFVRPRRWLFRRICSRGGNGIIWFPHYDGWDWRFPNLHWALLYWALFKPLKWAYWDGWRKFAIWDKGKGYLKSHTLLSRFIQRIGETTAGCAISGGECYHCASREGCPVELSKDETGEQFILEKTWTVGTLDGTDHRFRGTTICPCCGYRQEYEDGSL